jgi:16S rRNA pseudouridine516 synthase
MTRAEEPISRGQVFAPVRLDRFLSHAVGLTRSEVQRAVRAGRVAVDGATVRDPAVKVAEGAAVTLDGAPVGPRGPRYLMLHKPAGCVCATSDGLHPTVLDLLPAAERNGLRVVGRLDLDVTGLVLLTDDGDWSHRVSAPRRKCPKTYLADLASPIGEEALGALRRGVQLRGERRDTAPAAVERIGPARVRITVTEGRYHQVKRIGPARVRITVTEGRYHQVKRMFAAVGNRVTGLRRERIGGVSLDPALPPGGWRALTGDEVAGLADCGSDRAGGDAPTTPVHGTARWERPPGRDPSRGEDAPTE